MDLNGPLAKLLLGEKPRAGLVTAAGLHAAMNEADAEVP
jgi:hypothetical protein